MIPFKVQFDKLTEAYIKGEVNPFEACACFVGNLLNRKSKWGAVRTYAFIAEVDKITPRLHVTDREDILEGIRLIRKESNDTYSAIDISILESTFMNTYCKNVDDVRGSGAFEHPNHENALFLAFEKTLEVLRWIHEIKGEKVDDFTFVKREKKEEIAA